MRTITIAAIIFLLGIIFPKSVISQNCSCSPNLCCSSAGYCGTSEAYCGDGCQEGPCYTIIADTVTQKFFDSIKHHSAATCAGHTFYQRDDFLESTLFNVSFARTGKIEDVNQRDNFLASFARTGEIEDVKRELAAFFAHVTYETNYLCYVEENDGTSDMVYCDPLNQVYLCVDGKKYYGRGPLQLRWQFNYALAGEAIGFDGLNNPEIVSTDALVSFKTAIWFWMLHAHPVLEQGFGATIRALRGQFECDGANFPAVDARVDLYKDYCRQFGIDPGTNLDC